MWRAFVVVAALVSNLPAAFADGTWQGKVVDGVTGQGITGGEVCAGVPGRVDITCGKVGADGTFAVSYPKNYTAKTHCLYVRAKPAGVYFPQVRCRTAPGRVTARLVPKHYHVKGVVTRADSKQPVAGVEVEWGRPGAIHGAVKTDGAGRFALKLPAWSNGETQFNTYGVEPADLAAPLKADPPLVDYATTLRFSARGCATVGSVRAGDKAVPHLSRSASATDAIFTEVAVEIPDAKVAKVPPLEKILKARIVKR
jgi:hypothetical protein